MNKKRKKGGRIMAIVTNIKEYQVKRSPNIQDVSIADMIFDSNKRKSFYKNIDDKYIETKDEMKIFEEMNKRRRRG